MESILIEKLPFDKNEYLQYLNSIQKENSPRKDLLIQLIKDETEIFSHLNPLEVKSYVIFTEVFVKDELQFFKCITYDLDDFDPNEHILEKVLKIIQASLNRNIISKKESIQLFWISGFNISKFLTIISETIGFKSKKYPTKIKRKFFLT